MDHVGKAVILLSGGIDSSTTLAVAQSEGYEVYALSFDYQQRHQRELESARKVASALGVKKHLIITFDLREIGGSALTTDVKVPKDRDVLSVTRNEIKDTSQITRHPSRIIDIPLTYVPARNTIFLSFALAWAEVLGAEDIFIGANAVDYSGYPDCRPEYLRSFEEMANLATKASIEGRLRFRIQAPLIAMKKSEIIKRGVSLGLDYELTWSCYDPQLSVSRDRPPSSVNKIRKTDTDNGYTKFVPCGYCDSCRFRAKGFEEAGIRDPLLERSIPRGGTP